MNDAQRVQLMLETTIDLTMQGFGLGQVLRAFAEVKQFRALGEQSYPMCRALTQALIGQCLEPNTMEFEELLVAYRKPGPGDGIGQSKAKAKIEMNSPSALLALTRIDVINSCSASV
jgi:hypothetical protein